VKGDHGSRSRVSRLLSRAGETNDCPQAACLRVRTSDLVSATQRKPAVTRDAAAPQPRNLTEPRNPSSLGPTNPSHDSSSQPVRSGRLPARTSLATGCLVASDRGTRERVGDPALPTRATSDSSAPTSDSPAETSDSSPLTSDSSPPTSDSSAEERRSPSDPEVRGASFSCAVSDRHLMILVTRPAPTVRPPSRIAKRRPSSMAIGWMSETLISVLSPGMTISVPSGSLMTPVTSVVRK